MGYTHYWTYNPNKIKSIEELRNRFRKVAEIVRYARNLVDHQYEHRGQAGGFYDDVKCTIKGGLGEGTPMINESQIWFNGDAKTEMDHETFSIQWYPDGGIDKGFCKTARKPYDVLVCVTLLAMQKEFRGTGAFTFSSDGYNSEWETAKDVFTKIVGSYEGEIFPEEAHLEMA
jgi:hypothetical protein